jgi:hypothetical protein
MGETAGRVYEELINFVLAKKISKEKYDGPRGSRFYYDFS